ncbi:MAG TPA: hypothetical protein VF840_12795 [Terriglobales bacterium]
MSPSPATLPGGCDEDFSIRLDCNSAAKVSDITDACILRQGQDLQNYISVGSKKIHYLEPTSDFMEVVRNLPKLPKSRFQYRLQRLEWDGQGAEHYAGPQLRDSWQSMGRVVSSDRLKDRQTIKTGSHDWLPKEATEAISLHWNPEKPVRLPTDPRKS